MICTWPINRRQIRGGMTAVSDQVSFHIYERPYAANVLKIVVATRLAAEVPNRIADCIQHTLEVWMRSQHKRRR